MECLVIIELKSNLRHYGGDVAQFDGAQNSNSKVAIVRCPSWPYIVVVCLWEKH